MRSLLNTSDNVWRYINGAVNGTSLNSVSQSVQMADRSELIDV
jgi:hypothetical protein